jgi:hypothetical protein
MRRGVGAQAPRALQTPRRSVARGSTHKPPPMLDAPATGMEQGRQLTGAVGRASRTWHAAPQPTAAGLRARNEGGPEATAVRSGPRLSPTVGPAFRQDPGVEVFRRHSNNYGVVQRVGRLSRHLADRSPTDAAMPPQHGYRPTKLSQRLSDETLAEILAAYAAGATTREVGERFSMSHSSVVELLKRHGLAARRRSPSSEQVAQA